METLSRCRAPSSVRLGDGGTPARRRARCVDGALHTLAQSAFGATPSVAVVAVGGYGRGTLSPHSDVDLWIAVPRGGRLQREALRPLLYPLWDAGFQVGHAVGMPKELVERGRRHLHAATCLLDARLVTGDGSLFEELLDRRERWLRKDARRLVRRVIETTAGRHRRAERAGWSLAPDLKEDIGGLRDLDAAVWLSAVAGAAIPEELTAAGGALLAVREALHAETRRKNDRMRTDLQPRVARRLGLEGDDAVDALMKEVHSTARVIEHGAALTSDSLAERILAGPRRSGDIRHVERGIRLEDGVLTASRDGGADRLAHALRLLAAKASTERPLAPESVAWLEASFDGHPLARWSEPARMAFLQLLRGHHAPAALELLDHANGWSKLLPEWTPIRGRAQHDPYHRHTVDGHSFLTVAETTRAVHEDPVARSAAQDAGDLDALYLAALLHDVGKGSGGDHVVGGERAARAACRRMGLSSRDVDEVAALVRWHLLLPDTATRRDLDDGAVIADVVRAARDARGLHLLYILSVADGRATGPAAWSEWKAALVLQLYRKALVAIDTGEMPVRADVFARAREIEAYEPALTGRAEALLSTLPASYMEAASLDDMAHELPLLMRPPRLGEVRYRLGQSSASGPTTISVCAADHPGMLARTAGVLTLHRISILEAQAYSSSSGLALERFVVATPPEVSWTRMSEDLSAAYSGRLALDARVERKARDYHPNTPIKADVRFLQDASEHATIVEVRGPDALGILYTVAAGLSDLDLDVRMAKIDTLGDTVVDVFYVTTTAGTKPSEEQMAEVARALCHRLERTYGRS